MPDPRAASGIPPIRAAVILCLLVFSGVTLAGSVVPAKDGLHRTQKRLDDQIVENDALTDRLEHLDGYEGALRTDVWTNGRLLRSYGITDADEIKVR